MSILKKTPLIFLSVWVGLTVQAGGCSPKPADRVVVAGDRVRAHYTCSLATGEIVATTVAGVAGDPSLPKSVLFPPKQEHAVAILVAGPVHGTSGSGAPEGLESALQGRLAEAVVGMKVGERRKIQIFASVPEDLKESERFLQMARVRWRPKEKTMTRDYFRRFSKGRGPELGQEVVVEPGFVGKVSSLDGRYVTLRILPQSGNELTTDFGKGVVRDKGDHYEVELDVRVGTLIRLNSLAGRITEVGSDTFTIDFGHPFGGETLACDVHVTALEASAKDQLRAEHPAGEPIALRTDASPPDSAEQTSTEDSNQVEEGDIAAVDYTVRLDSGEVVRTTLASVHNDPQVRKASSYEVAQRFSPEKIWVGHESNVPGLSLAVAGMRPGQRQSLRIAPEEAYGVLDPQKILRFPLVRRTPRTIHMSTEEFANTFGFLPVQNKPVKWVPYFETIVTAATVQEATLENVAVDGKRVDEIFGITEVHVEGGEIATRLSPRIGAFFEHEKRKGRILSADEETFTVDFNHPLAGESLDADVAVVSLTKGSRLRSVQIPWMEDYEKGLQAAREAGRPLVLVLYAEWCPWSQRLLHETLEDPRIKLIGDRFVWLKVDSDLNRNLQEVYGQKSFPVVLLLSPQGELLSRHDGFQDAQGLVDELTRWVELGAAT